MGQNLGVSSLQPLSKHVRFSSQEPAMRHEAMLTVLPQHEGRAQGQESKIPCVYPKWENKVQDYS